MKTLQANPDLMTTIETLVRANPLESFYLATAILLAACFQLRGII